MIKNIIATIFILGILAFTFYTISQSKPSFKNTGKKGLINYRDSCIIISEDRDFFLNYPLKTKVFYKDSYGKYIEQEFHTEMVKIIK